MYGTLFHYDGAAWNKIPVDTLCTMGPIFDAPDGQVCIVYGYTKWPEMNDTTFYHYANIDGTKLVTLDTCITYNGYGGYETNFEFGNKGLWGLCGSEMYSAGTCLWKYNGSSWNVIYGAPDTYYEDIRGLSRNDIYIVGWSGIIRHYDGSDWQFIGHYGGQGINFYAVMPFEDEVFVSGDYQDNTYIVHSKVTLK
jgi:hypothetical protein